MTFKWTSSSSAGVVMAEPQWLAMPAFAITTSRCVMECLERLATAVARSVVERESIFTMMILLLEAGTMALRAALLVVSRTPATIILLAR